MEENDFDDPLFYQAINLIVETNNASISGIQRHFRIGYNRSARIVEEMELRGVVSEISRNGNREILISNLSQIKPLKAPESFDMTNVIIWPGKKEL